MKLRLFLSFVAGIIFPAVPCRSFQPTPVVAQVVPVYPGYECLRYDSSWVDRNELWHDYKLSEEAVKDGFRIRDAQVETGGHRISLRVTR